MILKAEYNFFVENIDDTVLDKVLYSSAYEFCLH